MTRDQTELGVTILNKLAHDYLKFDKSKVNASAEVLHGNWFFRVHTAHGSADTTSILAAIDIIVRQH